VVPLLVLLFVVVPLAELYVIVAASHAFGLGTTLGVLLLVSLVGAAVVKRQGMDALARVRESLDRRELPSRHLADGALILLAGALLLVPGFITDAIGVLLLLPPVRAVVRRLVLARSGAGPRRVRVRSTGTVIDTGTSSPDDQTPPRGELGRA
jgi:UPF0716 protein FxsA